MAAQTTSSFERLLPARDHFRGSALAAFLWSSLAALALFGFLTLSLLLLSLFEHRGQLVVPPENLEAIQALVGKDFVIESGVMPDTGLLPTVVAGRERLPGVVAGWLCRFPGFRSAQMSLIWLTTGMLVCGLIWTLSLTLGSIAAHRSGDIVGDRLRQSVHRQALRIAPADLGDQGGSEAADLFIERTGIVSSGVSRWLRLLSRDVLTVTAIGAFLLLIQWRVAVLCCIPIIICLYLLQMAFRRLTRNDELAQDHAQDELRRLAEGLERSRLVRAYGMEDFEQTQFAQHLTRYHDRAARVARGRRWQRTLLRLTLLLLVGIISVFVLGDRLLRADTDPGRLSLADAVLTVACLVYLPVPLTRLWHLPELRSTIAVEAGRIHRYLSRIPEVGQAVGAKFLQPLSRVLQFDAVKYTVGGRKLLDGVDLKINSGEKIAIISIDPAEARAVAWMIPRFIEPTSGRVLVDGEDIAWVTLESLRAETVFIPGARTFFTGTVLENLTCGSEYSLQQATEAARRTHAHKFILDLPQGYETLLGEHGEQPGAGDGFRLALARAILRKPALMVIEEPPAPLDGDSKALIDDAYGRLQDSRTMVFLPTRLGTIKRADRVVLIHNGRVEAIGTQESLLKSTPLYRHWEYLHFNEFRDGRASFS